MLLTTSYRAGPGLLAATGRLARRLRGPRTRTGRLRPLPERRAGRGGGAHVPFGDQRGGLAGARAARGAPARRRALVADGGAGALHVPGSCRPCSGRCTPPACRPWCTARTCRCTCSRRSRRCCSCCAARWSRTGSTRRRRSRCCTRRSAGPTRWPSGGCGRDCGRWRSPAVTARPSGELMVEALRDPEELAASTGAGRSRRRRWPGCSPAPGETAARPGATVEDVLWAVWHGQRAGRALGRGDLPGAGRRR